MKTLLDIVETIEALRTRLRVTEDPRERDDIINTIDLLTNSLLYEIKKAG